MSDSTVIALRVEKKIADWIRSWAKAENRTIANFMTNLVNRELRLREGQTVSLEALQHQLERIELKLERLIDQKE